MSELSEPRKFYITIREMGKGNVGLSSISKYLDLQDTKPIFDLLNNSRGYVVKYPTERKSKKTLVL